MAKRTAMMAAKRYDTVARLEATRAGAQSGEADGSITDDRKGEIARPVEDA